MRRWIAGALVGCALAAPATAHADANQFVADLHAGGYYGDQGDASLIADGARVCTDLDRGITPLAIATSMWHGTKLSALGASEFVTLAEKDLCPFGRPEY